MISFSVVIIDKHIKKMQMNFFLNNSIIESYSSNENKFQTKYFILSE